MTYLIDDLQTRTIPQERFTAAVTAMEEAHEKWWQGVDGARQEDEKAYMARKAFEAIGIYTEASGAQKTGAGRTLPPSVSDDNLVEKAITNMEMHLYRDAEQGSYKAVHNAAIRICINALRRNFNQCDEGGI